MISWAAVGTQGRPGTGCAGGGRKLKEGRRGDMAKPHNADGCILLTTPERVFVEAYAHISGCRTRPRLRLGLRGGNHKKWGFVPGKSALGIAI